MLLAFQISCALSAVAFVGYGVACLTTEHMTEEFKRFGLSRFRRLVGALELLGGAGLVFGYFLEPVVILPVASGGLTALMVLGVWTRLRIRDPLHETLPAAIFLGLNGFIFWFVMTQS